MIAGNGSASCHSAPLMGGALQGLPGGFANQYSDPADAADGAWADW